MRHLKLFEEFTEGFDELEVKESAIEGAGLGLFTKVDIDEGQEICQFTGQIISQEEGNQLEGERGHYLIGLSDGNLLDVWGSDSPAIRANDATGSRFENNSEIVELDNGEIWLHALRNIHAGEEILCAYGDDYWNNWQA